MQYIDYSEDDSDDLTREQIEQIWQRVIAETDNPSAAFDFLLADHEDKVESMAVPMYQPEDYTEYNVYLDIESFLYENPIYSLHNIQIDEPFAPPTPVKKDDDPDLEPSVRNLIEEQLEQSRFLRALSRGAPRRRSARALSLAANRVYSASKNLASAQFKHSGLYFFPRNNRASASIPHYQTALRTAWKREVGLTTRCADAADKTEDVQLMQALLAAAREHATNAVDLRRLITQYAESQYAEYSSAER